MIRDFFFTLVRPSTWHRLGKTDKALDAHIREAIACNDIVPRSEYTAYVGGLAVWTANYPYCYGHPAQESHSPHALPSRRTVAALRDAVTRATLDAAKRDRGNVTPLRVVK